jgi:hypothetical protein
MRQPKLSMKILALAAIVLVPANAGIVIKFLPGSDYNANTSVMDAALGITGLTIDTFESTPLIPGLSITLSGGVTTTIYTTLPALFNENTCAPFEQNQAWDGSNSATNAVGNGPNSCTTPNNIAKLATFSYAPGASFLGFGISNAQSANPPSPFAPVTNHELFVNGIDEGALETLGGGNWSPGLTRNTYVEVTGTGGTAINSVGVENLSGSDFLMFDRLAVQGLPSAAPEPGSLAAVTAGCLLIGAVRRRYARARACQSRP